MERERASESRGGLFMPALPRRAQILGVFALIFLRSAVALAGSTSLSESSPPSGPSEPATPPDVARRSPRHSDAKRFVVARDFGIAVPVGELAEQAATMYGPIVRLGWHPNDSVELGLRAGYQRGFEKESGGVTRATSTIPVYLTTRWFPFGDRSGPYGGLDVGVNVFREKTSPRSSFFDVSADATWARPSANAGVGWVWSRAVPIDLRVQLASLDLVAPAESLTIGVVGGYSIFF
jgi:hypothetical protein